jgi:predicted site-specific integrase-resolvase
MAVAKQPVAHEGRIPLSAAAQRLNLSWIQAWRLVLTGKLDGIQSSGRWQVSEASVNELLRTRRQQSERAT